MHYEIFELRIQPGQDDTYEALVTRSLAGDARALFTLPWADGVQAATLWQTPGRHLYQRPPHVLCYNLPRRENPP